MTKRDLETILNTIGQEPVPAKASALADELTQQFAGSLATRQPEPKWRHIMKAKLFRYAAAASIIIATLICIYHFVGSVEMSTIAFADISEAMKKMPWMHQINRGFSKGIPGESEQWFGFETKIHASKSAKREITFWDIKEHKKYYYDPEKGDVIVTAVSNDFPFDMSSPVTLLESIITYLKEEERAKIVVKETDYNGQKVQLQEISMSGCGPNEENHVLTLYIQSDSKLLLALRIKGMDAKGNVLWESEASISFPQTGPKDIYDLGVPRNAAVIEEKTNTAQEQK